MGWNGSTKKILEHLPHAGARTHWRPLSSTWQCGKGQPAQEDAQSPSLDRAFNLHTWFLPPRAYSPWKDRYESSDHTNKDKMTAGHEGEVGEAVRTCNLGSSRGAEVQPALRRSRCIKGPGRVSVWKAEHQYKARPKRWAELDPQAWLSTSEI